MGDDIPMSNGLIVCGIGFVYWFGSLYIGIKMFDCWWDWKKKRKLERALKYQQYLEVSKTSNIPSITITDAVEV